MNESSKYSIKISCACGESIAPVPDSVKEITLPMIICMKCLKMKQIDIVDTPQIAVPDKTIIQP